MSAFRLCSVAAALVVSVLTPSRGVLAQTQAPTKHQHSQYTHLCTLLAEPGNAFTFVPAVSPAAGAPLPSSTTFTVTYVGFGGYPAAQAAFEYAVNIWSTLVPSSVPIKIKAELLVLGSNVLGSAGALSVWKDFAGAPVPITYYGDALADRLRGTDNSPSLEDITSVFNTNIPWYFGTDGATPSGQYDFVSVVLHELGHGLGFFGSAAVAGGNGSIGISGVPMIYDRFTVSESNVPLLSFTNPSAALGTQLTQAYNGLNPRGPGVYWGGLHGTAANGGLTPRLFTAAAWSGGSSYSHLDDSTYPAGNANSLMTHALGGAEAVHNPGPITLGMFTDIGWTGGPADGDFNSDGYPDLLFHDASGNLKIWLMRGSQQLAEVAVSPSTLNAAWQAVALNDFNNDQKTDILWQHQSTGMVVIWYMNGTSHVSDSVVVSGTPWRVSAGGDLNGDGKADLVWTLPSTGDRYAWLLNGLTITADGYLSIPTITVDWRIAGMGDLNNDGKEDLVWQHTNGSLAYWMMNGLTVTSSGALSPSATGVAWRLSAVANFNGVGGKELVFQNTTNNQLYMWFMDGITLAGDGFMTPNSVSGTFKIEGSR